MEREHISLNDFQTNDQARKLIFQKR
jgi:hypothetical protein